MKAAASKYTMEERKEPALFKFDGAGKFLEGTLVGVEKVEIEGKPVVRYTVQESESGELVAFHGVHQINRKLRPSDIGRYVAITYKGEDTSVQRNGNSMKTFDVLVSKEKVENADALVITDADIPF
jgi:hypothetical protein